MVSKGNVIESHSFSFCFSYNMWEREHQRYAFPNTLPAPWVIITSKPPPILMAVLNRLKSLNYVHIVYMWMFNDEAMPIQHIQQCLTFKIQKIITLEPASYSRKKNYSFYCSKKNKNRDQELTLRGWFWTISTASWLLRCSQSPSDANIRNWSCGWSACTDTDGSALNIGLRKGSRRRNFAYKGSLLNSDFFRYTSPIDLETWKKNYT